MPNSERANVYGTMLSPREAEKRLRERGARMTPQRRAVLNILAGNRTHPTAEAVVAEVRERLGCVAPATIYNTLDTLEQLGFVRRLDGLESKAHFDPDTSDHQHAICTECGTVWDLGPMAEPPDVPEGFTVRDILIQGTCGRCAHETP
ncbi:transcriptional repressor [bacterium]|nr:transcriptional repressor [bacterium]